MTILDSSRLSSTIEDRFHRVLIGPVGRPPKKPLVLYHAASRRQARRVVAKVEWHQGELIPRYRMVAYDLVRYNAKGDGQMLGASYGKSRFNRLQ